jgi:oligoribonuclease (3'-5' exoribonuclease)
MLHETVGKAMPAHKIDHLLWLDLETDGSDEHENNIIEVGVVLTDVAGDEIMCEYSAIVSPNHEWAYRDMIPVIREMHTENGLLEMIASGAGQQLHDVEQTVLELLRVAGVKPHRVAMAGSGVSHFDARFIKAQMPRLSKQFVYWQLDMGHIRRFLDFSGFAYVIRPEDDGNAKPHRALEDALLHLSEYRSYQRHFGAAFAALIEQTRAQGLVVDNALEPVELKEAPEGEELRPSIAAPDVTPIAVDDDGTVQRIP